MALADIRDDPDADVPALRAAGLHTGAIVLAGTPSEPVGMLTVHALGTDGFTADDLHVLQALAMVIAGADARLRAEARVRHDALHDALTGLPNRALLEDRLRHALARSRRDGSAFAVLFLDLDNLKLLNDSLGHGAGDEVLRAIGPRLAGALRADDTVARFGGDEFVILCENVACPADAMRVAARVLDAFAEPITAHGAPRFVSTSVGVVLADGAAGRTPEELIGDADAAMYQAKTAGRGRAELFDERLRARAQDRLRLEEDLRRAIDRGELRVHYQPVVQIADGAVRGMEALVRWEHPELGMIGPDRFIPVAEETGLVVPLGARVLQEAVTQLAAWRAAGHTELRVSVNLSARQVAEPGIVDTVRAALAASGVPPVRVILEITEGMLLGRSPAVSATLDALRALGVTLILDDFGTGYSSLSYLRRYDLDGLKIDRTFVADLGEDGNGDGALIEAIVSMARALGLAVVPEGVETAEQLERLAEMGCALAQGYHLGRPMPAEAATAMLERRHLAVA